MMILNEKMVKQLGEFCNRESLENYVALMEDTANKFLDNDEVCSTAEETLDYVRALLRLRDDLRNIMEAMKE